MAFTFHIKPRARKNLDKIIERDRIKIMFALDEVMNNPFCGKKLHGKRKGEYSVRVWPYRILYTIYRGNLIIVVIDIDDRGSIYK